MMYTKPPITEAVIEFRFDGDCDEALREKIARKLKKYYPFKETIQEMVFQSGLNIVSQNVNLIGVKLSSLDRTEVFSLSEKASHNVPDQLRSAAFSVSQLAPYNGWQKLLSRFNDNWSTIEQIIEYRKLTRIGVRFVNRIDVPGHIDDSSHWVNVGIAIPNQLQKPITFNLQAVISLDTAKANILVGLGPSPLPHHSAIVLDIDIYTLGVISDREEERIKILEDFHKKKNQLFENCITEAARELFK